ncbi:nucleotidyltransferase domain-containing protein [Brachyspira hyodysenteriae]|nr:nucleotidyltransferase domain-containing protein [Brachyspira hyodysenteriae]MDA1470359.1 nucleotidyltransferase domain-containing protein [Brachyspira hyodysenteriae]
MLDEKIKEGIKNICSSYGNIEKVILFGSRAMDKEKYNSDIDLAVIGKFDLLFCERLKEELSELPTL